MKSKYLLHFFMMLNSLILSLSLQAAHHEKEQVNYKEGQKAVTDLFGWDLKKPTITTEKITDNSPTINDALPPTIIRVKRSLPN